MEIEERNEVGVRLKEFADSKGGFKVIAEKLGKKKEVFYNIMSKQRIPSGSTIMEIAEAYPDIDLNYIFKGIRSPSPGQDLDSEIQALKEELGIQKAVVAKLVGKPETSTKSLLVDEEDNATEASEFLSRRPSSFHIDDWNFLAMFRGFGSPFSNN